MSSNESKQALISLNETERTQKTLNLFKVILYERKMSLNKLK